MNGIEVLKACPLFQGLVEEDLQGLDSLCVQMSVEKGVVFLQQAAPATHLCVITHGRVAIELWSRSPNDWTGKRATMGIVGPYEALGMSAFVEPHILTLTARAIEPTMLLSVQAGPLRDILARRTGMGYVVMHNVAKILAGRLAMMRELVVESSKLVRTKETLLYVGNTDGP